jgi:hypothetical protein
MKLYQIWKGNSPLHPVKECKNRYAAKRSLIQVVFELLENTGQRDTNNGWRMHRAAQEADFVKLFEEHENFVILNLPEFGGEVRVHFQHWKFKLEVTGLKTKWYGQAATASWDLRYLVDEAYKAQNKLAEEMWQFSNFDHTSKPIKYNIDGVKLCLTPVRMS